jgi:YD repeat-containing protein
MKKLPRKITVTCTWEDWKRARSVLRRLRINAAWNCALAQTLKREVNDGHRFRVGALGHVEVDGTRRYAYDEAGRQIIRAFDDRGRLPAGLKEHGIAVTLRYAG